MTTTDRDRAEAERTQHVDTVVVGGGQAGLAMGYYLTQQECDFLVVDANERIGDTWRNRWNSLRLFTSARYSSLPGMQFPASADYFPTKDEMADYLESYAERFDLPVRLDTEIRTLTRKDGRYMLDTDSWRILANHIVIATGSFRHPRIPEFSSELESALAQLHSSDYRSPDQLPDGDILVVGAGNSGAEIATELAATGRSTWLAGRDTGHIPLGLFNSRIFWWLFGRVFTVDTWVGRKLKERGRSHGHPRPRLSSKDIRRAGVERTPRVDGVTDGKPRLEDGRVIDVDALVWATGFRPDYGWVQVPELSFDADGYPIQDRGVVDGASGLYFLGLSFQRALVSADIGGVGIDARYIADHIETETD